MATALSTTTQAAKPPSPPQAPTLTHTLSAPEPIQNAHEPDRDSVAAAATAEKTRPRIMSERGYTDPSPTGSATHLQPASSTSGEGFEQKQTSTSTSALVPRSGVDAAVRAGASAFEFMSNPNMLRRASAQVLPSSLSALVPSSAKLGAFPSSSSHTTQPTSSFSLVASTSGTGAGLSAGSTSPRPHIPRSSILLKPDGGSPRHLEWYEVHNGVPLALRIPAPITQKQREREKQLEREAREREREKELEREREKERAERNKLEARIWGIPRKALLLGLPEVNFNAQMAMLGGWGNGSGGPTNSSTPSTPSKGFLKEREREKIRQREREKQRSAEAEDERLDPEELAALNAIINTRRSMAAAQALASGAVVPPRPRRTSMNASSVVTAPAAMTPASLMDQPLLEESRSASRASTDVSSQLGPGSSAGRHSLESNRYDRSHPDSITSSTMSILSTATENSGVGNQGLNHPQQQQQRTGMESNVSSLSAPSPQSPVSLRYVPRIRFAPLPLPPPIDVSPPSGGGGASGMGSGSGIGPNGGDDDVASPDFDPQSQLQRMDSDGADTATMDVQTPSTVEWLDPNLDSKMGGSSELSTSAGGDDASQSGMEGSSANVASGSNSRLDGREDGSVSHLSTSDHGGTEGRRSATGTYQGGEGGGGGAGSGASTMRQSFESASASGPGGPTSPSLLLGLAIPGSLSSTAASSSSPASRKRPRFPRVDSEDSSRAGSSASGVAEDADRATEMDGDAEEGWRRRLSGGGKGKWYLMGMPAGVFKSMRRPGTGDSSRRRAAASEGTIAEGEDANSGRLTRRSSTSGVISPNEVVRKNTSASGTATLSSVGSGSGSQVAGSPATGPSTVSSNFVGSLGSQNSGGGFMSFFGLSDGDGEDRGRPSLVARNSSSRTSSRSRRRSGSRGSGRSREREREREVDYFTDDEERARRRKLVRSVRPGGTGMVTLPDGTKIPARRVVDTVGSEDRSGLNGAGGASAHDEEFDPSQWGFAGLARRSAGLNASTATAGTATTANVHNAASAPLPEESVKADAGETETDSITPASEVIAARMEKKSAAGSAEEVKRRYAEAEALRASTSTDSNELAPLPSRTSNDDDSAEQPQGGLSATAPLTGQQKRRASLSTVGANSDRRAGLSDGDGDTTVTPHSTPKAHVGGNVLAPLTALSSVAATQRSPAASSRSHMPGAITAGKATTASSDASALATGAFTGSAPGAGRPAIPSKASTPGLGLTLERAEIIRKRHEAEVEALGAEILANVKPVRRRSSTDDLVVAASGSKDSNNSNNHSDREMSRSSTMAAPGKDGAVLSKTKHERVGSIFNKDKHKAGATAHAVGPTFPPSPGEPGRSKGKSDPPRGRRLEGGITARESRSSSLKLTVEGSPASLKDAKRGVSTFPSPESTPMPSPAIGGETTPKLIQSEYRRGDSPTPEPAVAITSSEMKPSTSAPHMDTLGAASSGSSVSPTLNVGRASSQDRSAKSARSPDRRRISVDPKVSIPAPLDWLPRRPDVRGHHVVPLPQLGVRPRRPREGRVWDGWGYFSESEGDDEEEEEEEEEKGTGKAAHGSDSDTDSEDDDLDPETIAAEDRKTKFQQSRLTTKAAGQEIVHARASSGTGRTGPPPSATGVASKRRASAGVALSVSPPTEQSGYRLRVSNSTASLGHSSALPIPRQPRNVSSASSMRVPSRSLSQSPGKSRKPASSTVVRDDDSDDAEFWSPSAMQTMTNSSLPAARFSDSAASASFRARSAREKRLRDEKQLKTREKPERQDSTHIDWGWSAAHHPSLFDNR
ncbi:hypothetical protein CF327_g5231 [Tilletia walkeri]|nr:hypothetical protein CF327_g5231 [Tilletia walkeri]